ncbi:MAG TPA: cytochrome c oxidase accessory protein CcoG [Candidatus Limnocylindrales bacterium]|nr:cytochrome c oxidase accessory protein CcoG [Candidatus Limnocylindrales bacterium]
MSAVHAPRTVDDAARSCATVESSPSGASGRKPAQKQIPLYAPREEIYQREIHGPWQKWRARILFVLAGFYVVVPWATWNGRQAVWFDVPARKFYLLGVTFWPQDFIFLAGLLILGALGLFFFTTIAGRLWCGYACPQTVWTRFFMWIEWLAEGDRNRRIALDRGPWNRDKILRKAAKHGAWLAFSGVVGVTFVGYFLPIRELLPRIGAWQVTPPEMVFLAVASLALYADAGFMREQICKYACPYARFQGAMFDRATLTIFYDPARGEPRGHRRKNTDLARANLGHCIDCRLCVHVCPTGIDIREGTQFECIGCAACIDACDSVMEEVGYPKGLVRYTTESALAGKPKPLLRARVVGYGAVLAIGVVAFVVALSQRMPLGVDVIRDRARLYREISGGQIENVYTLKLMNKSQQGQTYRIGAEDGFTLIAPASVAVAPGELKDVPVQLRADRAKLAATSTPVSFVVESESDPSIRVRESGRFLAPAPIAAAKHEHEHDDEHGEEHKKQHEKAGPL